MQGEPFGAGEVKAILLTCLDTDSVAFSPHALQEMAADNITIVEAESVLRSGVVEGRDLIAGSWRYRVRKTKTYVVVAFDTRTKTIVVTAWRSTK